MIRMCGSVSPTASSAESQGRVPNSQPSGTPSSSASANEVSTLQSVMPTWPQRAPRSTSACRNFRVANVSSG